MHGTGQGSRSDAVSRAKSAVVVVEAGVKLRETAEMEHCWAALQRAVVCH